MKFAKARWADPLDSENPESMAAAAAAAAASEDAPQGPLDAAWMDEGEEDDDDDDGVQDDASTLASPISAIGTPTA